MRGHRLAPWRSPYLCWRLEAYWGIPAEKLDGPAFRSFALAHWRDILRYLRWADDMRLRHGA